MRVSNDQFAMWEVRHRIFRGQLESGTPIKIADLADDLQISAAPARDALLRLTERGLIARIDGRGFFVRSISEREMSEIIDLLAFIITYSITRNHLKPKQIPIVKDQLLNRELRLNDIEDCIDLILKEICSPFLASIAEPVIDRLWQLTPRETDPHGYQNKLLRSIHVLRRCLEKSKIRQALQIIENSRQFAQDQLKYTLTVGESMRGHVEATKLSKGTL